MRVLLSTIGSRGDVQPLLALAQALQARGHEARFCVPPDFREWLEGFGFPVVSIGPSLRDSARPTSGAAPTPEQQRMMVEVMIAGQFDTIMMAAEACDLLVGATALQVAAPSVAELRKIPYVFAAYSPNVLPSAAHAPPMLAMRGDAPDPDPREYEALWARDARRFDELFGPALNAGRAQRGLAPVADVGRHIRTERPWLAADAALAPWPMASDPSVFQTGAWMIDDDRPLPTELEAFLAEGSPPVYFGFGSMRVAESAGAAMMEATRALGRRAVLSRGWGGLSLTDAGEDCLLIDEVNQQALFPRVAAVVHHGGAGTTTAAAHAGVPQVVVPQLYDQPYWAGRVQSLGIGVAHMGQPLSTASLRDALEPALQPDVAQRAKALAGRMQRDGAAIAAKALVGLHA